ncbi:hypothetical protein EFK50_14115 [Nocardioides marmoriginsengisoli]|uniref:Uncharacterized protein n=1 Tax=Nocardioides marmoriginsengisoli TaxID=661483 RepID=A0A3N0CHD7_9ACTN|nr:hypothetical protein EFK50_14115 [Nocardioides marmoriginsengisoli]
MVQLLPPIKSKKFKHAAERLQVDGAARRYFERCYTHADDFSLSAEFLELRNVEWLGYTRGTSPAGIELTVHHVLVTDGFHGTRSLHQHVAFKELAEIGGADGSLRDLVRTLHAVYWAPFDHRTLPAWLNDLDPFLSLLADRPAMISASRQIYTSVVLAPSEKPRLTDWHPDATSLYSLLNLHTEGVDSTAAITALSSSRWQTTSFFAGFAQPNGLLSVAVPFPHDARPWSQVAPWDPDDFKVADREFLHRIRDQGAVFEPYDLSPEFPCLRYSSLVLLEYLGNAEFEQLRIRKRLDQIGRLPWPASVAVGVAEARKLSQSYFRTTSLQMLRLPIMRQVAGSLLETRTLSLNEKVIEAMRANLLNDLMAILGLLAIVVPIVQVVLAKVW